MNRPPAFQFYAADWFDFRVTRMSYAAQGVYIRLLAYMWKDSPDQCSLLNNDRDIAWSLGLSVSKWKKFRAEIQQSADPIFKETETHLVSLRLHAESVKQQQYRELQSKKGEASSKARFNRGSTVVQPKHQPEGNSSVFSLQSSSSSPKNTEDTNVSSCANCEKLSEFAPAEQSQNGVKRSRRKARLTDKDTYSEAFICFWSDYPKKRGRYEANRIWERDNLTASINEILKHVAMMSAQEDWLKDDGKYVPLPTTYLNQRRWHDAKPLYPDDEVKSSYDSH